jgi:flagellin-like protein
MRSVAWVGGLLLMLAVTVWAVAASLSGMSAPPP